jgi:hypothetical protein
MACGVLADSQSSTVDKVRCWQGPHSSPSVVLTRSDMPFRCLRLVWRLSSATVGVLEISLFEKGPLVIEVTSGCSQICMQYNVVFVDL